MPETGDFAAVFADLQRLYLDEAAAHAAAIAQGWQDAERALDRDALRGALLLLLHHVHRLAGTGGTFGYPAISAAANAAEPLLIRLAEAPALPAEMEPLLAALRDAVMAAIHDPQAGLAAS